MAVGEAPQEAVETRRRTGWRARPGLRGILYPLAGLASLAMIGCKPPDTPYPASIQSLRPTERIQGIKAAAERKDRDAIPLLVDRLEDEDEAVRMYAILALERLTGSRMGYEYYAPEPQRWRAVQTWKRYLREEFQASTPATQPAEAGAGS